MSWPARNCDALLVGDLGHAARESLPPARLLMCCLFTLLDSPCGTLVTPIIMLLSIRPLAALHSNAGPDTLLAGVPLGLSPKPCCCRACCGHAP